MEPKNSDLYITPVDAFRRRCRRAPRSHLVLDDFFIIAS
jgi:hypothetical protein